MTWDREDLQAAFQQDDRVRADYEWHERKWAERIKRSGDSDLVYKTHVTPPQRQQQATVMDTATQRVWNQWLTDYVARALERERSDVLTPAIGQALSEVRKEFDKKLTQLREELGALRADLTLQASVARGEVAELKGNVAAKRHSKDVA